jgi:hypothetical protein
MKLRLCSARPAITFQEAKDLAPNFSDARSLPERNSLIDLGVDGPLQKWGTDFVFDYDIFPSYIMRFEAEWIVARRRMQVGDIIVQRAVVPPIGFGFCMEFAVRISSVFEDGTRIGFAYETLAGHVERGISEFYFEERGESIAFVIHTFSEPAHWTARMAKPILTLPYQAWCTRRALKRVREKFLSKNIA